MSLSVVILAAGQGTRMRSERPKILHEVAGRPMLRHVIETARTLDPRSIHVVYGHGGESVRAAIPDPDLVWVEQAEQLGTGHAVAQALPGIDDADTVLVLCGDVPLITTATLRALLARAGDDSGLLAVDLPDPTGYGRILRDAAGDVAGIVEQKDADDAQRAITEVNTGVMCLPAGSLRRWLDSLSNDNAQGEYYLTDVVAKARREGGRVYAHATRDAFEVQGVNNRAQLATVERAYQRREAERLMTAGATLADPARIDIRGSVTCGRDVFVDVGCVFEGQVHLGDGCAVGPHSVISDSRIEAGATILSHCVIEASVIGRGAQVGPFAHLRPGAALADNAHIGNFVEIKKARIGVGSKVNHLSYLGDAEVGRDVNVGAGTITCNYDGANKHLTRIGDNAFIGSGTQLVAPVSVGAGATLGAGTTLREDAPPEALTLTGVRQRTIDGWQRPTKKPR